MPYADPEKRRQANQSYWATHSEGINHYRARKRRSEGDARKACDRRYYESTAEVQRIRARKYRHENPLRYLVNSARARANRLGIPFDLTIEDLQPAPQFCPALGLELVYGAQGKRLDSCATLDRVRPALGYVRGNVRIISWRANRLKSDSNLDELKAIASYVEDCYRR